MLRKIWIHFCIAFEINKGHTICFFNWWMMLNNCYAINLYMCIVSLFIHWHHHNKTLKENSKTPYQRQRHAQDKPDIVTLGTCVLMANNLSSDHHWGTVWEPYPLWICKMFFKKCIYKTNLYKTLLYINHMNSIHHELNCLSKNVIWKCSLVARTGD